MWFRLRNITIVLLSVGLKYAKGTYLSDLTSSNSITPIFLIFSLIIWNVVSNRLTAIKTLSLVAEITLVSNFFSVSSEQTPFHWLVDLYHFNTKSQLFLSPLIYYLLDLSDLFRMH